MYGCTRFTFTEIDYRSRPARVFLLLIFLILSFFFFFFFSSSHHPILLTRADNITAHQVENITIPRARTPSNAHLYQTPLLIVRLGIRRFVSVTPISGSYRVSCTRNAPVSRRRVASTSFAIRKYVDDFFLSFFLSLGWIQIYLVTIVERLFVESVY